MWKNCGNFKSCKFFDRYEFFLDSLGLAISISISFLSCGYIYFNHTEKSEINKLASYESIEQIQIRYCVQTLQLLIKTKYFLAFLRFVTRSKLLIVAPTQGYAAFSNKQLTNQLIFLQSLWNAYYYSNQIWLISHFKLKLLKFKFF